jgi:hypothetical protein
MPKIIEVSNDMQPWVVADQFVEYLVKNGFDVNVGFADGFPTQIYTIKRKPDPVGDIWGGGVMYMSNEVLSLEKVYESDYTDYKSYLSKERHVVGTLSGSVWVGDVLIFTFVEDLYGTIEKSFARSDFDEIDFTVKDSAFDIRTYGPEPIFKVSYEFYHCS